MLNTNCLKKCSENKLKYYDLICESCLHDDLKITSRERKIIESFIKNNPVLLIYKIIADYLNFKFIKQTEDLDLLYLSINKTLASKMLKEISYEEDKGGCTSCKKNSILKKYLNLFYKQNNGLEI